MAKEQKYVKPTDEEIRLYRTKVGTNIRMARTRRRLPQWKLGRMVGCTQFHISRLEWGDENLILSMLYRLSKALNVMPEELVDANSNGRFKDGEKTET